MIKQLRTLPFAAVLSTALCTNVVMAEPFTLDPLS